MAERGRSQSYVSAFARGLDVIQAFDGAPHPLSLSDVAERAGVDRAVARRMLLTLCSQGFATCEAGRFQLTPKILRLGFSYISNSGLEGVAPTFVAQLSERIGESCSISVLDGCETVSVMNVPSQRQKVGFLLRVGSRWPAFVMASGRIQLAALDESEVKGLLETMERPAFTKRTKTGIRDIMTEIKAARERGFAIVEEELEEGLISLAVPIVDRRGKTVASLNASSNINRNTTSAFIERCVPEMTRTAGEIGQLVN